MRIRTFIFLTVIALGLLPLFILVSLNLPRTVSRFESAALLESQAVSKAGYTRLNSKIRCISKSLQRSATLPFTNQVVTSGENRKDLSLILSRWFKDDMQVEAIEIYDRQGAAVLTFSGRNSEGDLLSAKNGGYDKQVVEQLIQDQPDVILAELVEVSGNTAEIEPVPMHALRLSTPVRDLRGRVNGMISMTIDLTFFLDDYLDAVWADREGKPFFGCIQPVEAPPEEGEMYHNSVGCGGIDIKSVYHGETTMTPFLTEGHFGQEKISWMPLIFGTEGPVMWVGNPVDESNIHQWKRSLLVNVISIVCLMTIIVFVAATLISRRLDRIRTELVSGLDELMSRGKRIEFDWKGPREVEQLSQDLSLFSEHYMALSAQRNRAMDIYRESEEKFRRLAESAQDAIILIAEDGTVAYWNRAAENLLGTKPDQMEAARVEDILTIIPHSATFNQSELFASSPLYSSGKPFECTLVPANRRPYPAELALSSVTIKGHWHGIWLMRDISERKKSEEDAIRQQQQLLHADKMISLGLLVAGVAHEINNPNSIALLNVPLLIRSWSSIQPILDRHAEEYGDFSVAGIEYSEMREQLPEMLSEMEESAVRIRQIVKDLKDYARQEGTEEFLPVDINDVVRAAVRLTMPVIRKATTRFSVSYAEDLPPVNGIQQRLIQVFINLLQNSCEALRDPGESLTVTTGFSSSRQMLEVTVKDQGGGIDSQIIDKICDPFFTTRRRDGGTGLGLSVSAGIIKHHRGRLVFTSDPGKLTTATVELPIQTKIGEKL